MNRAVYDAFGRPDAGGLSQPASDRLIGIADIRELFKLGRTAAYELTHRPEFPDPIEISPHCYRWWASEVDKVHSHAPPHTRSQPPATRTRPATA